MTVEVHARQSLAQRANKIKSAMSNADCGPLIAAAEVIDIVDHWDDFRAEAGGIDYAAWLERTFGTGRTLAFWQRRHEAVQHLGEASRRTIHHDVAIWVVQSRPPSQWDAIKVALMLARKENGDNAISLGRARILVASQFGAMSRPRGCNACRVRDERIATLETTLRDAGVPIPE
jgi:hypothetical protein